jgi:hypothetical protein
VAIFSTVMVIALGALLSMSESDRKSQSLKAVINNLNFSIDSLTRSLRVGDAYHCDASVGTVTVGRDCQIAPGASSIAFHSANGSTVVYCRGTNTACDPAGTEVLRSQDGGVTFAAITAPEVAISNLNFYVIGAESATVQSKATILMSGTVKINGAQQTQFSLETSVTQRLFQEQ